MLQLFLPHNKKMVNNFSSRVIGPPPGGGGSRSLHLSTSTSVPILCPCPFKLSFKLTYQLMNGFFEYLRKEVNYCRALF